MAKKKSNEGGTNAKAQKSEKDGSKGRKQEKLSVSSCYTDGIDLLPSYDEDEHYGFCEDEEAKENVISKQNKPKLVGTSLTVKQLKKREKKEMMAVQDAELIKREVLKDDPDAYTVVIRGRASVLDDGDEANANVKDISIQKFSVSICGKVLLEDASLTVSHGKRYGLVGPNGMGKSSLLKLLAWRKIPMPKNIDVLLVEQEIIGDDRSALEAVVSANEELVKIREEVATLQNVDGDDNGERLVEMYEKLQILGSDAAEAVASKILAGLGFTKDMQGRPTKSFSGGWRMRISLARALFIQPALLLLDEPSNHLDLRAVLWLEEYLCRWKKTLIIVSHDRDFLNTVCNEIIHVHDKKLQHYTGNFDDFQRCYEQQCNEQKKEFDKQKKAANRSGNQVQQKKVKEKGGAAPRKWRDYTVEFHFPEPTELTPPLLQLIDVGFSYPDRPDFRLSNVDLGIDMGTRVAVVGPNGAGKSTLLNLLMGDLSPTEGEVRRSHKLRIGRYSQHFVDLLTMNETPVQYLLCLHPHQEGMSKQEAVRAKLGKFGLPSNNHLTPIVKLSGGQKARVVFTSISMSKPHILLLDEPTNHLDMQSIDALADALTKFTGGVVLVSHDSRLISSVCGDEERSQIWVVDNGTVRTFPGAFEDYKEELLREIKAEVDD